MSPTIVDSESRKAESRRLGIVCDLREEEWPSMDLVVEMLDREINRQGGEWRSLLHCPPMPRLPAPLQSMPVARNVERLSGRWLSYPASLRKLAGTCDAYHVADHSYAHLAHFLPAAKVGVFCHDIDLFNCLVEPEAYPRPLWFRLMARVVARGLKRAAVVFHTTQAMRELIEKHRLVESSKLVKAPYGIASEFTSEAGPGDRPDEVVPGLGTKRFVLHVGSCIPRKRIDVLLDVFARLRAADAELKLVQIGGQWTPEQQAQIDRLGLQGSLLQIPRLTRDKIARLYRTAAVTLMPSEAEGFGLPVAEALACGSTVVASSIGSMREAGGQAALYCPVADVEAWSATVLRVLGGRAEVASRSERLAHAERFTWRAHAKVIVDAYTERVVKA